MWLLVGLGNPGTEYARTRHNLGFMCLDRLALDWKIQWNAEKNGAIHTSSTFSGASVILIKPQAFMNLSGHAVQAWSNYYKVQPEQLVVIHDELDLPFGQMKLQQNRGAGGHNGVKSIQTQMGHHNFVRLRMGVGKPEHPSFSISDYVLQAFSKDEENLLPDVLNRAGQGLETLIASGFSKAATQLNGGI